MEYDKVVSDAIKESEKTKQEEEIKKIKGIVQKILEKIDSLKEKKVGLDKEIRVLEDDLSDLKKGRMDKIEERQEKDPDHKNYTIIVVKRIEKEYIPMYPWRSPWIITIKDYMPFYTFTDAGISD